ncbi:MAG TPA: glutamate synthase subunit beta [Candidatus Hydrogenedens sp.]|nr:glutamate synthase subunit beta [Candidatus Hydrogenedens sp.]HOK09074.1 glutamate synthase subunit beta [Candidatus Hydrogenedens sp.]HOL19140.1 glutamate synthase subunit beta [Candidatus Hydrogenedens sp.]HPP58782.1 glutamate synthase subunit beta [Candidatus Hydrogenedens sp.]
MLPPKSKGFMVFQRELGSEEPIQQRIKHFREFHHSLPEEKIRQQAYRCMNCGVPFCHHGCPLGNQIPDFNDCVKDGDWKRALEILHSTNNFPEFTGRVCPAPCESSCVLGINEPPVTIEQIEYEIAERGWREGWIKPEPPEFRTGKRVAIIGSGPSGLSAGQQLNRAGHTVHIFERADEPGGLLMYGIPGFKLDKSIVWRRLNQLIDEGVVFKCSSEVGQNIPVEQILEYDAVLFTIGSTVARTFASMNIPGSSLSGIHTAMDFLTQSTRRLLGKKIEGKEIVATNKNVIVIGGGDTGSDCIGTSIRQGCKSVVNLEVLPRPPLERTGDNLWPQWPMILRTSSSHEEGGERLFSVMTKSFEGDAHGHVKAINLIRLEWYTDENGQKRMREIPGTEMKLPCELVILAMGFVAPETDAFLEALGLELTTTRFGKAIKTNSKYMTTHPGIFSAGDARRGQSLVVWAISEGRESARYIDEWLMGKVSYLHAKDSWGYSCERK